MAGHWAPDTMVLVLPANVSELPPCIPVSTGFISEVNRVALSLVGLLEHQGRRRDGHLHVLGRLDEDVVRLSLLGHLGQRPRQRAEGGAAVEDHDEGRVTGS